MTEDDMLKALGVDIAPEPLREYTQLEERLIAGFEDIQRFVEQQGQAPRSGDDKDIFERLYAIRLDRLRKMPEAMALLAPMDHQGLLTAGAVISDPDTMDEDAMLQALQGGAPKAENDITVLRHVRSHAQRQAAEEVANRELCKDFERFQPLFDLAQTELENGHRKSLRFGRDATIEQGDFFILAGQWAYVAHKEDEFKTPQGHLDARLRVIFSNGTESDLLMRSLQRALYKDDSGRRLTSSSEELGPLFADKLDNDDVESGTIYVLRSFSTEPFVAEHRELIHKIGVTGDKVEKRIANAKHDATYLLAEVEIVATYKLAGIQRVKLEALLHRVFAPAQLELTIKDRFGKPVQPKEWFLVPLAVIDEAVTRIRNSSIINYIYNPREARLQLTEE